VFCEAVDQKDQRHHHGHDPDHQPGEAVEVEVKAGLNPLAPSLGSNRVRPVCHRTFVLLCYADTSQLEWTTLAAKSVVGCEGAKNSIRSCCQFGRLYRRS
jgi:hypothetical protein